jgi:hypothetical protein
MYDAHTVENVLIKLITQVWDVHEKYSTSSMSNAQHRKKMFTQWLIQKLYIE